MAVTRYEFVVLGGGVAGLAFAWRMARAGRSVLVLEKDTMLGGLSRTFSHNGYLLEYCGHRFHTGHAEVLSTVLALPGLDLQRHSAKIRIHMFGRYLKYPFQLPNLLRAMPVRHALAAGVDFIGNRFRQRMSPAPVTTYRDWFIRLYGKRLYAVMCEPYTSKIWKMDPAQISPDWAEERFGGPNLLRLMKASLKKLFTLDFSSYDLEDEALAPDGGIFYFPTGGIGEIPAAFARQAREAGGEIKTGVTVERVEKTAKRVVFREADGEHAAVYDVLISTIPLSGLYRLQDEKDPAIENELTANRYMDMIFVYLFLGQERLSNDHWIYFPDPSVVFNRAVEFVNWSTAMAPKGKTAICLDISCYAGDELWATPDAELARQCIQDGTRMGYFREAMVEGWHVERVRFAYPVYDLGYRARLQRTGAFLETGDVYLLGRTGMFRYNNSDGSIAMALDLARKFLDDAPDKSLLRHRFDTTPS